MALGSLEVNSIHDAKTNSDISDTVFLFNSIDELLVNKDMHFPWGQHVLRVFTLRASQTNGSDTFRPLGLFLCKIDCLLCRWRGSKKTKNAKPFYCAFAWRRCCLVVVGCVEKSTMSQACVCVCVCFGEGPLLSPAHPPSAAAMVSQQWMTCCQAFT